MIWCRFTQGVKRPRFAVVEGDVIRPVDGGPFDDFKFSGEKIALADVTLDIPVIPGTFFAMGSNYQRHLDLWTARMGKPFATPKAVHVGYRANNALIGHGADIRKPPEVTEMFHYEGELVVVIGKPMRNVAKEDVMKGVFGYTIGNDVSARTWQFADPTMWRGKNSDTFKPMGPWITTSAPPSDAQTIIRLNGKEHERFDTFNMLFDIPTCISTISQACTLSPGDVLWMGTDGMSAELNSGDDLEIEISGIGTLRNRIV